jgi:hypothetical protein
LFKDFFKVVEDARGPKQQCVVPSCGKLFSIKTTSKHLTSHIQASHIFEYAKVMKCQVTAQSNSDAKIDVSDSPPPETATVAKPSSAAGVNALFKSPLFPIGNNSTSITQRSLHDALKNQNNNLLPEAQALFFATNGLSHYLADRETFTKFVDCVRLCSRQPLKRKELKTAQMNLARKMKVDVLKELIGETSFVTLAVDGWTDLKKTKVTNVSLICNGVSFYWKSIFNHSESDTAQYLCDQITPMIEELIEKKVKIVGYVADNASVMDSLHKKLLVLFPFLVRVPCAAHTLQLAVDDVLKSDPYADTIVTAMSIIKHFSKSKGNRLKLKNNQQVDIGEKKHTLNKNGMLHVISDSTNAYCLIQPVDTRWNSMLMCLERIQLLQHYVQQLCQQSDDFWSNLSSLITLLKPYRRATNILQSDHSTLYDVYEQFQLLIAASTSNGLDSVTNALVKRWKKQVNKSATLAAAKFSFIKLRDIVSDANIIEEVEDSIIEFGVFF